VSHTCRRPHFREGALVVVVVEVGLDSVVGDEQVGPAVVVIIGRPHGEIESVGLINLGRFGHIREGAVVIVVVQHRRRSLIRSWPAACGYAIPNFAMLLALWTEIGVTAHVEVEPAIPVIVKEGCAGVELAAKVRARDPRLGSHIRERAVAIVVVKHVAAVLGDVQVGIAIVIVVAPDAAQTVRRAWNPRLIGHIGERPVAIVAVQSIAYADAAPVTVTPVYEVDILVAVAVEVGNAYAGPCLFQDGGGD